MTKVFEAIVIGAGYIGCSVAYYLSKAGVKTALLDRESVGGGASRANFGNIQVQDAEMEHSLPMIAEGYSSCLEIEAELDLSVGFTTTWIVCLQSKPNHNGKKMESRLQGLHQVWYCIRARPGETAS